MSRLLSECEGTDGQTDRQTDRQTEKDGQTESEYGKERAGE